MKVDERGDSWMVTIEEALVLREAMRLYATEHESVCTLLIHHQVAAAVEVMRVSAERDRARITGP